MAEHPTPPPIVKAPQPDQDIWGIIGSIAGGVAGGLLLVAMCFSPFACLSVPLAVGGLVSAMFAQNEKLKTWALVGNAAVVVLSLLVIVWMVAKMFMFSQSMRELPYPY